MSELRRCDTCLTIVPLEQFYTDGWQRGLYSSVLKGWPDECRRCTERRKINEERDES